MGVPLLAGRAPRPDDPADAGGVVLSAAAAAAFWPGEPALGRTLRLVPDGATVTVVGVAGDVALPIAGPARPALYRPIASASLGARVSIVARAVHDAETIIPILRDALAATAPDVPAAALQTMNERMALPLWMPRTIAGFFGTCSVLAVVLSTVGLLGVTFITISQRRREFGLRACLGASPRRIHAQAGLLVAAAAMTAGRAILPGLSGVGVWSYAAAAALQAMVALGASALAGRRAVSASPLRVLRAE
jgi:hypothetical protein